MNSFSAIEDQIQKMVPLAGRTTLGVGGPARYLLSVRDEAQLRAGLLWARSQHLPFLVLGGGSNLVLNDEPFPGLVLDLVSRGLQSEIIGDFVQVTAAAGEPWDELVATTVADNLAGLECLSGIPGRVGAAPIQNIGAYGRDLADVLHSVRALDSESLEVKEFCRQDCGFGYRDSIFKSRRPGRYIILEIKIRLEPDGQARIQYPDLTRRLPPGASLQQVRDTVLAVRRSKSMVVDPGDPNSVSCGSFFTNPILDKQAYQSFAGRAPQDFPRWEVGPDAVKLSAAWLIEQAGFPKGYIRGQAGLSQNHCLAIINRGGATASEIKALMREIQEGVLNRFGVQLEPEPVIL